MKRSFLSIVGGLGIDAAILKYTPYYDWFLDAAAHDPCAASGASENIAVSCPSMVPTIGIFGLTLIFVLSMSVGISLDHKEKNTV